MATFIRVNHEGYPLSSLGKNFNPSRKSSIPDKCSMYMMPCICVYENECCFIFMLVLIVSFLWPILPVIVLFTMCWIFL